MWMGKGEGAQVGGRQHPHPDSGSREGDSCPTQVSCYTHHETGKGCDTLESPGQSRTVGGEVGTGAESSRRPCSGSPTPGPTEVANLRPCCPTARRSLSSTQRTGGTPASPTPSASSVPKLHPPQGPSQAGGQEFRKAAGFDVSRKQTAKAAGNLRRVPPKPRRYPTKGATGPRVSPAPREASAGTAPPSPPQT